MALALLPALAVHVAALALTTATTRPQAGSNRPHPPGAATLRFVVATGAVTVAEPAPARQHALPPAPSPAPARPSAIAPEVLAPNLARRAVNDAEPAVEPAPPLATDNPAAAAPPAVPGVASAEGAGMPLDYLPRALLSVAPQPLATIDIPFPQEVQGSVNLGTELALFIDEAGTVRHVRIDGAPLPPALAEAARSTFLSARFTPGELHGAPVRSLIRVAIRFDTDLLPPAATAR